MKRPILLVALALLVLPALADAGPATGYGETDYAFSNRRDCCEEATLRAQEDSVAKCRTRGGHATIGRSARGRCSTKTGRDGRGRPIYACTAEAKVDCR
jgi:hypothetical protein